jgi:hypothetical protein
MVRKHAAHRQRVIEKQVGKADKARRQRENNRAMQGGCPSLSDVVRRLQRRKPAAVPKGQAWAS